MTSTVRKTPPVEYPPDPWPPTDPEQLRALAAELETFDFPRGFRTVAQRGACLGMPPERFFLPKGGRDSSVRAATAKEICSGCPVRRTCLLLAMHTSDVHGFWGGTNQKTRVRLRGTLRRLIKEAEVS